MRRSARPRHYLMCPPTHFDVVYSINPWMDPKNLSELLKAGGSVKCCTLELRSAD